MKKLHIKLLMIGLGIVMSNLSYANCLPVGNQSKATCKQHLADKEEHCIEKAKTGLDNTDQGADGYQQKQYYLSQINGGCKEDTSKCNNCPQN